LIFDLLTAFSYQQHVRNGSFNIMRYCTGLLLAVTKKSLRAFLFAGLTLAATSCQRTAPRGYVAKEWSETLRELSIIPVFPPREDVQVGDIYAAPSKPEDEEKLLKKTGFLPIGVWIASIGLSKELSQFYSHRNSFPRTTGDLGSYVSGLSINPFPIFPQPTDLNANIFLNGDTNRLRLVGFPSFMSATIKQADLAGVIPSEALSVAFAGTGSKADSITLSVPVAESYGLPASEVFSRVVDNSSGTNKFFLTGSHFRSEDILTYTAHQHLEGAKTLNRFGYVRVITEVFYARAVDLAVNHKRSFGVGASVKPVVTLQSTNVSTMATDDANGASTNYLFTTRTETGTPQERAADLNRQLNESLNQSIPGGSVKFVSASEAGVTMRRTYDRPVAIGYRALLLKVFENGDIESSGGGVVGSMLPTARP
jgi:hypothetical protein